MSRPSSASILRKVIETAQNLRDLVGSPKSVISPHLQPPPIPPLELPFPHDIVKSIDSLDIPESFKERLKNRTLESVSRSQDFFLQSYKRTCLELPATPSSSQTLQRLCGLYRAAYEDQHLRHIRGQIIRVQNVLEAKELKKEGKKPIFNCAYTPLLEKYFEMNAYPSTADRLALAHKTTMTPRQIEVWFQNHRNRSKGRALRRLHGPKLADIVADMGPSSAERTPESRAGSIDYDDDPPEAAQDPTAVFSTIRPAHAFPAPYVHASHRFNDPMPGAYTFPVPPWRRRPATQTSLPSTIDMDEVTSAFASKLRLRDATLKTQNKRKDRSSPHGPWFAHRITVPSAAPHPALVRSFSFPDLPMSCTTLPTSIASMNRICSSPPSATPGFAPFSKKPSIFPKRSPTSAYSSPVSSLNDPFDRFLSSPPRSRLTSSSSVSSIETTTPEPPTPPLLPTDTDPAQENMFTEQDFSILNELFPIEPNAILSNNALQSIIGSTILPAPKFTPCYDFTSLLTMPSAFLSVS